MGHSIRLGLLCSLLLSCSVQAAVPASDSELAAVRGMDTNGKVCSAMTGNQCNPAGPWGGPWTDCFLNQVSIHPYPNKDCGPQESGAACAGNQTDDTPNHDVCNQTQVSTNNCVLHNDGYCVSLYVGTCQKGSVGQAGTRCSCNEGSTMTSSGQRDYCM